MDQDSWELFAGLRDRDYARDGLLVCEGRLVLEKALRAGLRIRALLCVPADAAYWQERVPAGTPLLVAPRPVLAGQVGFAFHRGVLALAERPAVAGPCPAGHALVLWNVTDPDNLGALARSALALGCASLWLGSGCADPYGRKALRASMGCTLTLPVYRIDAPPGAAAAGLAAVREAGQPEVTAASRPAATAVQPLALARRLVAAALVAPALPPALCRAALPAGAAVGLVLGNEGWGLPADVVAACDVAVALPMAQDVDSLNVAAAGAILMWELFR